MNSRNMIDEKDIKRLELNILIAVDKFCREKGLRYFLCYGTLLGAVRHRGFIPWDDDIDIMMPREDYNEFINSFENQDFKLATLYNQDDYYYPFAKVFDTRTILYEDTVEKVNLGVYIDIFPIDGFPSNEKKRKQQNRKIVFFTKILRHKYSSYGRKRNPIKKGLLPLVKLVLRPLKSKNLGLKLDFLAQQYSYMDSDLVGCLTEDASKCLYYKKSWLEPLIETSFEGYSFYAPHNVDLFLKRTYGDYMKLPPIEQQRPTHNFKAYWL